MFSTELTRQYRNQFFYRPHFNAHFTIWKTNASLDVAYVHGPFSSGHRTWMHIMLFIWGPAGDRRERLLTRLFLFGQPPEYVQYAHCTSKQKTSWRARAAIAADTPFYTSLRPSDGAAVSMWPKNQQRATRRCLVPSNDKWCIVARCLRTCPRGQTEQTAQYGNPFSVCDATALLFIHSATNNKQQQQKNDSQGHMHKALEVEQRSGQYRANQVHFLFRHTWSVCVLNFSEV